MFIVFIVLSVYVFGLLTMLFRATAERSAAAAICG